VYGYLTGHLRWIFFHKTLGDFFAC